MAAVSDLYHQFREVIDLYKGDVEKYTRFDHFDYAAFLQNYTCHPSQFMYVINYRSRKTTAVRCLNRVLGYDEKDLPVEFFFEIIHPSDKPSILEIIKSSLHFASTLYFSKPFEYTLSVDYRVRKKTGIYIRVLRQSTIFEVDQAGKMVSTLNVCTDISKIKTAGKISYSISCPDAKSVDFEIPGIDRNEIFTRREKEILRWMVQGYNSAEIAEKIFLSEETIRSHRKKILAKTKCSNTPELIAYTYREGLL